MPPRQSFKSDESFREKITIGAIGTQRVMTDLQSQGHQPVELDRGSLSSKIWKTKIKRVRVPDILCLRCAHRVEVRTKRGELSISMSHSTSDPEREWRTGLAVTDRVAFVSCSQDEAAASGWTAGSLVQYVQVGAMAEAAAQGFIRDARKGVEEAAETWLKWPATVAQSSGVVTSVTPTRIQYREPGPGGGRMHSHPLGTRGVRPLAKEGDSVEPSQILAAVVPVSRSWSCPGGAQLETFINLAASRSQEDRFTAMKALGYSSSVEATNILVAHLQDEHEEMKVRLEAAAGLARQADHRGVQFLESVLNDPNSNLSYRVEAIIILGEIASREAVQLLIHVLQDGAQVPEVRAGAAWALGEIGEPLSLTPLITSFNALDAEIRDEAARALAKLARRDHADVLAAFPLSSVNERPGIAWALGTAGQFTLAEVLATLVDDDTRQWVAYIIGTQDPAAMEAQIGELASRDAEIYFAVTVLWKIFRSWIYKLEEQ